MRLATDIPAYAARLSDLVERDVQSTLTVHPESLISLPPIPLPRSHPGPTVNVQRDSFIVDFFDHLLNPETQIEQIMCTLGRGLWTLTITAMWQGNWLVDAQTELSLVRFVRNGGDAGRILGFGGHGASIARDQSVTLTVAEEDDLTQITMFLPTPPAAGNQESMFVSIYGAKLL